MKAMQKSVAGSDRTGPLGPDDAGNRSAPGGHPVLSLRRHLHGRPSWDGRHPAMRHSARLAA
jgi:hypothetical protein